MWPLQANIDTTESWAYVEKAFTKEQCEKIIKLGESLLPDTATTFSGTDLETRNSKVSWIKPSSEHAHLFACMTDLANKLNSDFFKFDLDGFAEGLQFTKYEAPSGMYCRHIDKSYGALRRKLSLVVQLSDPEDYEGGELEIQIDQDPFQIKKQQGFVTAFPSYVLHGVKPVTKGTRYSLVAWITGPAFK